MTKRTPLLTLRPAFDPALTMAEAVPVCLVGVLALALLGGTFLFLLLHFIGLGRFISMTPLYVTLLVLGFAFMPAAYYEIKKRAYARTVFHFHADTVEYQYFRWLLFRRRGRTRLRDISDVMESTGFLQERRGLSSLYLVIPSAPWRNRRMLPGIEIRDVPGRKNLRETVITLIEQYGWARPAEQAQAVTTG